MASEPAMSEILWAPSADRIAHSRLRAYLDWLQERESRPFPDHDALWEWSVQELDRFWLSIVDYFDVDLQRADGTVRTADPMPFTRWFPGARLNWAQHLLRAGAEDATALVCLQEGGGPAREITFGRLRAAVASTAGWLRRAGVVPGDRVAAYLPNTEHAVIAALAAAAVGAVWACCSPDFGAEGTLAGWPNSNPPCCWPPTGTTGTARTSTAPRSSPSCGPDCRRCAGSCTSRTCSTVPTRPVRPRGATCWPATSR
jgi:acetoacetyl-CoA synthetase